MGRVEAVVAEEVPVLAAPVLAVPVPDPTGVTISVEEVTGSELAVLKKIKAKLDYHRISKVHESLRRPRIDACTGACTT